MSERRPLVEASLELAELIWTLAKNTLHLLRLSLIAALTAPILMQAALTPDELKTLPRSQIEAKLPGEHPSAYYVYAGRLFAEGKKDESIVWFYIGQLRYRIHLKANPSLEPSGDPALFASLNATVGLTINEYAGGDPKIWTTQISAALMWDEEHPNDLTSKKKFGEIHTEIRTGLAGLKKHVEDNATQIREERKKRGLSNRG